MMRNERLQVVVYREFAPPRYWERINDRRRKHRQGGPAQFPREHADIEWCVVRHERRTGWEPCKKVVQHGGSIRCIFQHGVGYAIDRAGIGRHRHARVHQPNELTDDRSVRLKRLRRQFDHSGAWLNPRGLHIESYQIIHANFLSGLRT